MKAINAFQCDTCKAIYLTEGEATCCEELHATTMIKKFIYTPGKMWHEEVELQITFPDGRAVTKIYF